MIYDVVRGPGQLTFVTASRARRGRGILFALAPVILLIIELSVIFTVLGDKVVLGQVRLLMVRHTAYAACLSVVAYFVGHRIRERVEATSRRITIARTPAIGRETVIGRDKGDLELFAIRPRVRSLGADILLLALCRDGTVIFIAEGEPHSGQMQGIAQEISALMDVPLRAVSPQAQ